MQLLKRGSRGEDVKKLQRALSCQPDGIFGPVTEEAVRAFQKDHGLGVDGLVGEKTWSKLFPVNPRSINEIIVHCSATKAEQNFTVDDIRRWHLARGFADIGYHYIVYLDGSVHTGRDEKIVGAHCTSHNAHSIGVCYIGGLDQYGNPADTRTPQQKEALVKLLRELKVKYPNAKIYPHNKFAAKACPCFDAEAEYKGL